MSIWTKVKEAAIKLNEMDERAGDWMEEKCMLVENKVTGGSTFDNELTEVVVPQVVKASVAIKDKAMDSTVVVREKATSVYAASKKKASHVSTRVKYTAQCSKTAYRAAVEAQIPRLLHPTVVEVAGQEIEYYVDDVQCDAMTGDPCMPQAAYVSMYDRIVVNTALTELEPRLMHAVLLHEVGHREAKHTASVGALIKRTLGMRSALDMELVADQYAVDNGYGRSLVDFLEIFNVRCKANCVPAPKEHKARIESINKQVTK